MRLTSSLTLALLCSLLPACGSGGSETGTDSTGTPGTTGTTGTPGTTSASGTTGDPTTGVTTGNTTEAPGTTGGPATSTTGEPATSTTGEPVTSTTTGETTTGTTGGSGSSSDTDTTGEPPSGACKSDADCQLHDDCCDCYGMPVGPDDPSCALECKQSQCSMLGIDQAVCRFGACITEKVDCDGSKVVCKALPPACPEGSLPGVEDTCWTGSCVPVHNCNAVPTCDLCPAGEMCVQKISQIQTWPVCEPIPAECGGEIDCECAGLAVCTDPFNACGDPGGNELTCGCPAC